MVRKVLPDKFDQKSTKTKNFQKPIFKIDVYPTKLAKQHLKVLLDKFAQKSTKTFQNSHLPKMDPKRAKKYLNKKRMRLNPDICTRPESLLRSTTHSRCTVIATSPIVAWKCASKTEFSILLWAILKLSSWVKKNGKNASTHSHCAKYLNFRAQIILDFFETLIFVHKIQICDTFYLYFGR